MTNEELLAKAMTFACEKHKNQKRRDGTPYIYHPLSLAQMAKDRNLDFKYQIVALLHDTLEDTNATEEEIKEFGDDVLEAVKLLTRKDGMKEEDYIKGVLSNHMAATIKNFDIVYNITEAGYCEDKDWAEQYVKKTKYYTKGKFSVAVDGAFGYAKNNINQYPVPKKRILNFDYIAYNLYSDIEKGQYESKKDLYFKLKRSPDFKAKDIKFYYHELMKCYFLHYKNPNIDYNDGNDFWILDKAGWWPSHTNFFYDDEYGDYINLVKKETVNNFVNKKIEEKYFYDFVDLTKLNV